MSTQYTSRHRVERQTPDEWWCDCAPLCFMFRLGPHGCHSTKRGGDRRVLADPMGVGSPFDRQHGPLIDDDTPVRSGGTDRRNPA